MFPRRTGRQSAIVTIVAVICLAGMVAWFGRDQISFMLAFESLDLNPLIRRD